jgi:2-keto-4-pentenoate hydratase
MPTSSYQALTEQLLPAWQQKRQLATPDNSLPQPTDRAQGYAAQKALFEATGESAMGWKIAATSIAGQQHIGVSGPLAGRLLTSRCLKPGASISLTHNLMRVMEPEFAFRIGRDVLANSPLALTTEEVMSHVQDLHLAIEIPDSRWQDFVHIGEAMLLADFACANQLVLGEAVSYPWRDLDLSQHAVQVLKQGVVQAQGSGANVLGDPRKALAWLANELLSHGMHLRQGDTVITGTCVVPVVLNTGDDVLADFGVFGTLGIQVA